MAEDMKKNDAATDEQLSDEQLKDVAGGVKGGVDFDELRRENRDKSASKLDELRRENLEKS